MNTKHQCVWKSYWEKDTFLNSNQDLLLNVKKVVLLTSLTKLMFSFSYFLTLVPDKSKFSPLNKLTCAALRKNV